MNIDDLPDPAPLAAVAELVGKSPRWLRQHRNEYAHVRIGQSILFRRWQAEALLATYGQTPAAKVVAVHEVDDREIARRQIAAARSRKGRVAA